jgi:two-component system, cell cycle sensor histidine kinase and response regulator CckA
MRAAIVYDRAPEPGGPPMSVHSQSGNGTILLAEDEALLRELGQTILTQAGYTVLTIYRREDLIALLESYSDPVDILLTDVVMPEISSRELISLAQARWPNIQVIYMSGYSSDDLTEIDHNAAFLQKPFTPAELMATIRKVMGR